MNRLFKGLILLLLSLALVFSFSSCNQDQGSNLPGEIAVESITLNLTTKTMVSGETFQIEAKAYPENASQEFTFSSANKDYVTVSSTGLISVKNTGNDTSSAIRVTVASKDYPSVKKVCSITVKVAPPSAFSLPKDINMVTSGPGEDASTSVVISWHAKAENSTLEYKKEGDADYTSVPVTGTKTSANWADLNDSNKYYRCKQVLTGLTPNTDYVYRIKNNDGTYTSADANFRTAASDTTTFQFMWLSDLHTPKGSSNYVNRVKELINFAQAKEGVDLDFVLFTGDMVNKGQIYKHWNYWSNSGLMNDLTYAFVAGNHDYYPFGTKDRTTNDYFKDVAAYPANNDLEGDSYVLDSNYWFIWNRVMFVCVDNFTSEGSETRALAGSSLSAQQAWFKAVVDANAGNYDYLIFAQHLPWFNTDTAPCDYGYYTNWYKIFDEYKVDYALSSDEHTYRRTYPLYDNDKTKAEFVDGKVSKGTVYVTSNQTEGSSISSLANEAKADLKYVEYTAGGIGGVYFTVTPTEMTLHLIGSGGKEKDTITVLKKDR